MALFKRVQKRFLKIALKAFFARPCETKKILITGNGKRKRKFNFIMGGMEWSWGLYQN